MKPNNTDKKDEDQKTRCFSSHRFETGDFVRFKDEYRFELFQKDSPTIICMGYDRGLWQVENGNSKLVKIRKIDEFGCRTNHTESAWYKYLKLDMGIWSERHGRRDLAIDRIENIAKPIKPALTS